MRSSLITRSQEKIVTYSYFVLKTWISASFKLFIQQRNLVSFVSLSPDSKKTNQIYLASTNFSRKRQKTQKNQQAGFPAERCLCVRARERHMHDLDSRFFLSCDHRSLTKTRRLGHFRTERFAKTDFFYSDF